MLTAFQAETVAYAGDGEVICRDCAVARFENEGGEAVRFLSPLSRYTLDEWQSETNYDRQQEGEWPEGCTDDCEPFVESCGECGTEIGEPYHYGHAEPEDENDPALD